MHPTAKPKVGKSEFYECRLVRNIKTRMDNSIGVLVLFTCIGFVGLLVLWSVLPMTFFDLHPMWMPFLVAGQLMSFFAIKSYLQSLE